MSKDTKTIAVYDAQADDYAVMVKDEAGAPDLAAFIAAMPVGGLVLDLGCGPGHAAAEMIRSGLRADAVDASKEMVAMAKSRFGVTARLAEFGDIDSAQIYDGVWASFSLLHAPKADFPAHLTRLKTALKPGGLFYLVMKTGAGEHRDSLGRYYAYYSEAELVVHLEAAGFVIATQKTGSSKGLSGEMSDWCTITAHG